MEEDSLNAEEEFEKDWAGMDAAKSAYEGQEFPDPVSLDVPILPELPRGIFPPWAESFIEAVAESTETPRELAAMMELGTIATASQRKFIVQVQPGYTEPLNLWPTPALPSGNRKTQVLHAVTRALRQWSRNSSPRLDLSRQKPKALVRRRSRRLEYCGRKQHA